MEKMYDIGIVGGGPAGYTAALHAAARGLSVILFEKDCVGGVCLNKGCIPTKTILHSAELFEELKCGESIGIFTSDLTVDFAKVIEHKNQVVLKLRKSLELMLKNRKVTIVNSKAKILDSGTIEADGKRYECSKIIAAVGSEPGKLCGIEFDHKSILSSDDVLNRTTLPKSIVIIGSGAIGTEWARIFSAFGSEVFVVESADCLLPAADFEVSKRLERIFKSQKIKVYKGTKVSNIEIDESCKVYLENGEVIETEKVLAAVGRKPCDTEKIEGVSYIGDACGEIQLAHFAIKQAISEIDGIFFDKKLVPSVIYGNPEIAWVGKREQDLEDGTYKKSLLLISALGKSQCDNSVDGFIKLLSQDGKIVGAHIISKEASSLIHQVLIAMQNNIGVEKLKEVCFAHPTYSEGIFEALFNL